MSDNTNIQGLSRTTIEKLAVLLGERPRASERAALRKQDEARILEAVSNLIAQNVTGTGSMQLFAGSLPNGWVPADGSALSRTAYPDLFRKIGVTFGAGDGSTTFNIPNEPHATLTWAIRT